MNQEEYLKKCFDGEIIYGDNFNIEQIENWFEIEKEGYSSLDTDEIDDLNKNIYHYHDLNKMYGFKYIKDTKLFKNVLGIGSATGIEFEPIVGKIENLFILEPSEVLKANKINTLEVQYVKPSINGAVDFEDNKFDLITSFGVLHHIPNVSFVMSEIYRVLNTNGILLFREPVVSMGDWREKRNGLTKNERGLPIQSLKKIIAENGFEIIAENYCFTLTTPINKIFKRISKNPIYYYKFYLHIDKLISKLFRNNIKYHAKSKYDKLYPQNVFFVLKKRNN